MAENEINMPDNYSAYSDLDAKRLGEIIKTTKRSLASIEKLCHHESIDWKLVKLGLEINAENLTQTASRVFIGEAPTKDE